jgi:hypothetical protein
MLTRILMKVAHPKKWYSSKMKRFIFLFIYAPSFGQANAEPTAVRSASPFFCWGIFQAPNPFRNSFLINYSDGSHTRLCIEIID